MESLPNAHVWYHSEHSDIPYSPNQFLDLDLFFAASFSNIAQAKTSKTEIIFNLQQHYVSKKLQGQMIQEKITTGVEKLCKWVVKMSCQAGF